MEVNRKVTYVVGGLVLFSLVRLHSMGNFDRVATVVFGIGCGILGAAAFKAQQASHEEAVGAGIPKAEVVIDGCRD